MKTTEFKAIVIAIETKEVEKTGAWSQTIFVKQPERKDDFGEVVQKETIYPLNHYFKDVSKSFLPENWLNKKVVCEAYVNSRTYTPEGKKEIYIVDLSLKSMKGI